MKKILVSLPDGVVEILDKEVIGKLGEGYSDTLRAIIMNWLGEQGYLARGEKPEKSEKKQPSNFQEGNGRIRGLIRGMKPHEEKQT